MLITHVHILASTLLAAHDTLLLSDRVYSLLKSKTTTGGLIHLGLNLLLFLFLAAPVLSALLLLASSVLIIVVVVIRVIALSSSGRRSLLE